MNIVKKNRQNKKPKRKTNKHARSKRTNIFDFRFEPTAVNTHLLNKKKHSDCAQKVFATLYQTERTKSAEEKSFSCYGHKVITINIVNDFFHPYFSLSNVFPNHRQFWIVNSKEYKTIFEATENIHRAKSIRAKSAHTKNCNKNPKIEINCQFSRSKSKTNCLTGSKKH